jgi:hypothetical protein
MAEIAPEFTHPVLGETMKKLLQKLDEKSTRSLDV